MLELNKVYEGDNVELCKQLDNNCIDLTVTSPPYDNLRTYNGFSWDFEALAKELYRVTKDGGVVVWVVGDATVNGSETGTSFKQALYFKEIGFNLHDTMIYCKGGCGATGSNLSYWQEFEFMFVFSKGKIKTFNPIEDRKNKVSLKTSVGSQGHRYQNGDIKGERIITRKPFGKRNNIWTYHESGTTTDHPAKFPDNLAADHIRSWSNEGDLVFDPFCGSGTTAVACKKLNRNYIGIDISPEYCDIARKRIERVNNHKLTEWF